MLRIFWGVRYTVTPRNVGSMLLFFFGARDRVTPKNVGSMLLIFSLLLRAHAGNTASKFPHPLEQSQIRFVHAACYQVVSSTHPDLWEALRVAEHACWGIA